MCCSRNLGVLGASPGCVEELREPRVPSVGEGAREVPEESMFARCSGNLGPEIPRSIDGVRLAVPVAPKVSPVNKF